MNAPRPWIKICGVTTPEDAELVVAAGADALGVNLVPRSKRAVDLPTAQTIAKAVRGKIELIGVVADRELEAVDALRRELGLDWLQLHGNEPPGMVARLQRAYKAIGISMPEDVTRARACPGERLLVDRKVGEREQLAGVLGGSGQRFDWTLVVELARARPIILAGGLTPDNVSLAIATVSPWGVDVASGVESAKDPRRKYPELVKRFVERARSAKRAVAISG